MDQGGDTVEICEKGHCDVNKDVGNTYTQPRKAYTTVFSSRPKIDDPKPATDDE